MKALMLGYDARHRPLHISPEERRVHTHIIGSSGSGKSKFMEWNMRGDLRNRQGFTLVDPHGPLYEDVAAYCARHVLDREIIQLNLSSPDTVIGFNPFQKAREGDISVQVDRRIKATMHAWNVQDTDQTPTLARTLRLIYTAMLEQNLGLPQVQHLIDFNAKAIRSHIIEQLHSPLIQKEWRELQDLQFREWRDETLSARNRLFKFLTSTALARFMGVPGRTINLQEIMDQGKVLLVNLAPSDHLSADNARAFGALLVNEFFECARRRKGPALGQPPKPHYLYIDEFANFVSLDIADMLDQVRKFGLFMVLAHQRFGQIDENLVDAVLTNCGIKAVFGGLSVPNARRMAEELFIGELDAKRVKVAIYQTKFWPKYARDKVYSRGRSHTVTSASTQSSATGNFNANSSSLSFQSGDWFGSGGGYGYHVGSTEGSSFGNSHLSGSSESHGDAFGETESEADIPILLPVPFQELSSVQYYTPEEQLIETTAALKEQFQRHCFIKIGSESTQPLLVPFVKQSYTSRTNRQWYERKKASEQKALPGNEVDKLIAAQEQYLINAVSVSSTSAAPLALATGNEVEPIQKSIRYFKTKQARASLGPLDKALKNVIGRD